MILCESERPAPNLNPLNLEEGAILTYIDSRYLREALIRKPPHFPPS